MIWRSCSVPMQLQYALQRAPSQTLLVATRTRELLQGLRAYHAQQHNLDPILDQSLIRNIGIIAHIDAGKTTTTERMLYYSGTTRQIGDVDHGSTVTDFLPAERARGITIQSAAISFSWQPDQGSRHWINLIDTPGHADFSFEVHRSLRILDGVVVILDAVAGVEAQTEKVWRSASSHGIPRLAFINKLDREGAGYGATVMEIAQRLACHPLVLQLPYYRLEKLCGCIDVLSQKLITFDGAAGSEVRMSDLPVDMVEETANAKSALIETISSLDDEIIEVFLALKNSNDIPLEKIKKSIRKLTLDSKLVPVFCGASFRNVGVQTLLDGVVSYLPNPLERPHVQAVTKDGHTKTLSAAESCALAFKVSMDPQRGFLVFVRVYSGKISKGMTLVNSTVDKTEKAVRICQVQADDMIDIPSVSAGSIAVIIGLKHTRTGDTLLGINSKFKAQLVGIPIPLPVFYASIEPHTVSDAKIVNHSLEVLIREDPSLAYHFDDETGQIVIGGMGELHLEITRDRLIREMKAPCTMGPLRVGYRETITTESAALDITYNGTPSNPSKASLSANIEPFSINNHESHKIGVDLDKMQGHLGDSSVSKLEIEHAIIAGVEAALAVGPLYMLPMYGVRVMISDIILYGKETTLHSISCASRLATTNAIKQTKGKEILEPIMSVNISTIESDLGPILAHLTGSFDAQILELESETAHLQNHACLPVYIPPDSPYARKTKDLSGMVSNHPRRIKALVALGAMRGYNKVLRALTGGRATFTMAIKGWEVVRGERLRQVKAEIENY